MALELEERNDSSLLIVRASGKLTKADYDRFMPMVNQMVQQVGKIRILFIMRDFHGWSFAAAWKDFKFGVRHYSDIGRLALVGNKRWQSWMSTVCRPFTKAEVRYFNLNELDLAEEWIGVKEAMLV